MRKITLLFIAAILILSGSAAFAMNKQETSQKNRNAMIFGFNLGVSKTLITLFNAGDAKIKEYVFHIKFQDNKLIEFDLETSLKKMLQLKPTADIKKLTKLVGDYAEGNITVKQIAEVYYLYYGIDKSDPYTAFGYVLSQIYTGMCVINDANTSPVSADVQKTKIGGYIDAFFPMKSDPSDIKKIKKDVQNTYLMALIGTDTDTFIKTVIMAVLFIHNIELNGSI